MRARILAAAFVACLTVLAQPLIAHAAPAPIPDENLKTLDPTTVCVSGADRPFVNATTPRLQAFVPADAASGSVSVQFRVTNLADGTEVFAGESSQKVPGAWFEPGLVPTLTDGNSYGWQARVVDGTEYSPWSNPCELTVDTVRPNAPGLTVTPAGLYRVGQKISLTFTNAGSTDVAEYGYTIGSEEPTAFVPACPGKAKVQLARSGLITIKAWSFDHAGNRSAESTDFRIVVS
jgi:hypothetical protein